MAVSATLLALAPEAWAETGYDLWLRYAPVEDAPRAEGYRRALATLVAAEDSPTARAARDATPGAPAAPPLLRAPPPQYVPPAPQ